MEEKYQIRLLAIEGRKETWGVSWWHPEKKKYVFVGGYDWDTAQLIKKHDMGASEWRKMKFAWWLFGGGAIAIALVGLFCWIKSLIYN